MQHLDDPALLELIARRDASGLAELYDRYHRLVFSIAINVVGRTEDAEEITLDVFNRIWQKAGTYRAEKALVRTWLSRMARNRAIDVLRREEIRPMKHSVSWAQVAYDPPVDHHGPETAAQLELQKERVRAALNALPDIQKEVLALAYFKGYSHTEIASELNLPLGTVKGRIRAGMQALRAFLDEEGLINQGRTSR